MASKKGYKKTEYEYPVVCERFTATYRTVYSKDGKYWVFWKNSVIQVVLADARKKQVKEIEMEDIELKPCPECGGQIKVYSVCNPSISYSACAICQNPKCRKEYPLPNVKLKTWKSNPIRISKSMIRQAEKEWNKLA